MELYKGSVRICTGCSIKAGMDALAPALAGIHVPVLMVHGTHDLVCEADRAEAALGAMPTRDKTWLPIEGAWHDLEFDYDKELWHARVLDWLQAHAPE